MVAIEKRDLFKTTKPIFIIFMAMAVLITSIGTYFFYCAWTNNSLGRLLIAVITMAVGLVFFTISFPAGSMCRNEKREEEKPNK